MKRIALNLKFLRKKQGITQQQLADKLGVKRAVIGSYEESRAEPNTELLLKIGKLFDILVDDFIGVDFNEDWDKSRKGRGARPEPKRNNPLKILSITVDNDNNENIELVPLKASAGYLDGYSDPAFVSALPRFRLPFLNNGTFRAFELKGDSMLPIPSGSVVIGKYLDGKNDLKVGETYIIISKEDGIVYKRFSGYTDDKKGILLSSDNKVYRSYLVNLSDVVEIWQSKAVINTSMPDAPSEKTSIEDLSKMIAQMQKSIDKLQKNHLAI